MTDHVVSIVKQELQNALDIKEVQGDIRVLQGGMDGLREQHKAHSAKMDEGFDEVKNELKAIAAQINTWKGSIGTLLVVAGVVGAGFSKAAAYFFKP